MQDTAKTADLAAKHQLVQNQPMQRRHANDWPASFFTYVTAFSQI